MPVDFKLSLIDFDDLPCGDRHLAVLFEHEAERRGVKVLYRTVPETDPITDMLLRSILQAMDEWHSLTSRRKGLAGMAENVRKGFRAGGRAPLGYKLEQVSTGAIREGQPVVKTRLIPGDDAAKVAADQVDRAIVGKVMSDLTSPEFVAEALRATKGLLCRDHGTEIAELRAKAAEIERRIDRFLDMAGQLDSPGPVLRKVDGLEQERQRLGAEIVHLEDDEQRGAAATALSEANVARMLSTLADELQACDREALKDFLAAVLERVDLQPDALTCQLHYRISMPSRIKLASPRGFESIPIIYSTSTNLR